MKGAGGGKRKGRKSRVESDDRPRGYEATRMRQLWRDIDVAKHKAGLGRRRESVAPPPDWDVDIIVERAVALIGGTIAWVTANVPVALGLLAGGIDLLRGVPLIGRLAELLPPAAPPEPDRGPVRPTPSRDNGHRRTRPRDPDTASDPDRGWVH
jgi:hypothetical protein